MSNWRALDATADYLHTNEPLQDLHFNCVEHATRREIDGRHLMRKLEQANRARYIPRVGWVANFETPKKVICALLAMQMHNGKPWFIKRTK